MSDAQFKVSVAGPLVSFQDAGRFDQLRYGVSASGPMDRFAHASANALIGNALGGTCIEVSLGGVILECTQGATSIAVAGGSFSVLCGASKSEGWQVVPIRAGEKITIRAGAWGSWCYLAFAGALDVPEWLGSVATHTLSGMGGGTLKSGDFLRVTGAELRPARAGDMPCPIVAKPASEIPIVIGPQDQHFPTTTLTAFTQTDFAVSDAFDRMGMRLNGPHLAMGNALSIPSEPIMRGSVQVSGDGVPTVLLADHQTTGGYPKIATVLSSATDRLAQMRSGDRMSFMPVTPEEAVMQARDYAAQVTERLAEFAAPRASLADRLMQMNLISGVTAGDD